MVYSVHEEFVSSFTPFLRELYYPFIISIQQRKQSKLKTNNIYGIAIFKTIDIMY